MEGLLQRGRGPPSVGAVPLSEALQVGKGREGKGRGSTALAYPTSCWSGGVCCFAVECIVPQLAA